jgi:single-stranded DNA-binding protein
MVESWLNGDGTLRERKNRIQIEVVGKDSADVAKKAKLGSWVTLEGYIRSEQFKGQDLTKVRTLAITVWEADD